VVSNAPGRVPAAVEQDCLLSQAVFSPRSG